MRPTKEVDCFIGPTFIRIPRRPSTFLLSEAPRLNKLAKAVQYQVISPFGAPGRSMGGIQIDSWSSPLRVPVAGTNASDSESSTQTDFQLTSRVESLELAPRSSKSIAARMQFDASVDAVPIERRRTSDSLQGQLVNPLGVDLLDSMLIYRNIVYLLPTRFPAGATVKDVDQLRQKNFRWQLSRQRALESSSQTEAWDVTRSDQPERLAEMLMFHEVVGGVDYTGLQNHILGHLDVTELLTEEQCVLVGRCREPWLTFGVSVSGEGGDASSKHRSSAEG